MIYQCIKKKMNNINLEITQIDSYNLLNKYLSIVDSYVLDFYVCNLWNTIPKSWQKCMENFTTKDLVILLDPDSSTDDGRMWPLSLIIVKKLLRQLAIGRNRLPLKTQMTQIPALEAIKDFWKNVKEKKKHEITNFAECIYNTSRNCKCTYIVDVGCGMGHLSRILNYGYGLKVMAIDYQIQLIQNAKDLDEKLKASSHFKTIPSKGAAIYVPFRIDENITAQKFYDIIRDAFQLDDDKSFQFGIVGLHPCGNLASTLLRLYVECPHAKFINIVNCCYMKGSHNFPLSTFCKSNNINLSYVSKELACHAIEKYFEKLSQGQSWKFKVHAYRALLEKFIVEADPNLLHSCVANTKMTENLTFKQYCQKALSKLDIKISDEFINDAQNKLLLNQWFKVVIFYTTKLLFAPLVESIILRDRLLYALENGSNCRILPIFDPKISPRNHVLIARKDHC